MTCIAVRCPHCQSAQIIKRGKTGCGTQRDLCQNTTCATGSFLFDYRYLGQLPAVKHQIIAMRLNASGVRDTARVLRISTDTGLRALRKKEAALESVHTAFLRTHNPDDLAVGACWKRSRAGRDVVVCRPQRQAALVVACDRSSHGGCLGVWLWAPQRRTLSTA